MKRINFIKSLFGIPAMTAVGFGKIKKEYDYKTQCCVCGKNLIMKNGLVYVFLQVQSCGEDDKDPTYSDRKTMIRDRGIYKPNKQYKICMECFLKALGARP